MFYQFFQLHEIKFHAVKKLYISAYFITTICLYHFRNYKEWNPEKKERSL